MLFLPLYTLPALLTLLLILPTSLSVIIPHCFYPGESPDLQPTNLHDCKGALRELIAEPGFTDRYRFSRNQRIGVKVPKWWRSGECIILVSCTNNFDSDTFRYVDVLARAKTIFDQCVNVTKPEIPWGGLDRIGTQGSFFVSVNGMLGEDLRGLTNHSSDRGTE